MYSKFQPTNPNHLWTGGDPIYGTSDEKTMTLALIEDYLADQRDGTGAFFTYHFPLPLRTTCSESSLGWKETLAGNSAWACLCALWASASLQGNLWWYRLSKEQAPAGGRRLPEQSSKYADELAAPTADQQTFPHWWKGIGHKVCFPCWEEVCYSFGLKV